MGKVERVKRERIYLSVGSLRTSRLHTSSKGSRGLYEAALTSSLVSRSTETTQESVSSIVPFTIQSVKQKGTLISLLLLSTKKKKVNYFGLYLILQYFKYEEIQSVL